MLYFSLSIAVLALIFFFFLHHGVSIPFPRADLKALFHSPILYLPKCLTFFHFQGTLTLLVLTHTYATILYLGECLIECCRGPWSQEGPICFSKVTQQINPRASLGNWMPRLTRLVSPAHENIFGNLSICLRCYQSKKIFLIKTMVFFLEFYLTLKNGKELL